MGDRIMPSIIRATTTNGVVIQPDNSGSLILQTNNGTTALTIDTSQNATFAGTVAMGSSFLRNRIINGDMRIDQRNNGAAYTVTGGIYTLDRYFTQGVAAAGVFTIQQQSSASPTGFTNYARAAVTTNSASVTGSQAYGLGQVIEGFNISDLGFGTASPATITASFWVRSSVTGTFSAVFFNNQTPMSYPFTYTISSANTWTYITQTITGPTTGTWNTTNSQGLYIIFDFGSGSTVRTTAGSWQNGSFFGVTGSTSLINTNGATWDVTGIQIEVGSSATPFERRLYNQELANCQRYYERIVIGNMQIPNGNGSAMINPISFHVQKRASPTMATITAATTNGAATIQLNGVSVNNFGLQFINSSTTNNFFTNLPIYSATIEL